VDCKKRDEAVFSLCFLLKRKDCSRVGSYFAGLDKAYAVNIKGTALVTKHISKLMKTDARGGAIVNISSISSQIAQPGFVPYSMTKAAIAQMTRNTALDLGQYNIRSAPFHDPAQQTAMHLPKPYRGGKDWSQCSMLHTQRYWGPVTQL